MALLKVKLFVCTVCSYVGVGSSLEYGLVGVYLALRFGPPRCLTPLPSASEANGLPALLVLTLLVLCPSDTFLLFH